ncbi:hypothetical protein C2G38_2031962 [Gigaspora rosea]|uniref:Uncharacterized protein n=1 Tax=Gigaspora rosea TaxID=44941 RepID=A0A397VPC9_9GLOM|nr:hypothetical protein C2G38_2031962 [Gigaspora rosea]
MLTLFHNVLSNSTYENISYQFYKYISQVVEEKLNAQGDIIFEILEHYVETKWIFDKNPTRVAYEKSFGSYDVSKCRQYVDSPTSFMRLLFENDLQAFKDIKIDMLIEDVEKAIFASWEELEKSIASWEQHFLSRFQISFYSLDIKGIDVCYPLSTITIPILFSEVGHLKLMIENFWSLRNALQDMIELVIEINENLEHLFDSKPSKIVKDFFTILE